MNIIGFIKPNYPNEKRVALLPEDINNFPNKIIIEENFGEYLNISDEEYLRVGCSIATRKEIFKECDNIFSLKLIQESDYSLLRENQMIIGWTHPTGSGASFMRNIAILKNLIIVDLDNIHPKVYYKDRSISIDFIPKNFIKRNSYYAGFSSVIHALLNYGIIPDSNTKVAILSPGNVAQGAFDAIAKFNCYIELYYRKTLDEFYENIEKYDIIINGIEVDTPNTHIITKEMLKKLKKGTLIIDSAADAGNAIEGTHYTKIDEPIYKDENEIYYYEVNNAPSIFYRTTSRYLSKQFSKYIFSNDVEIFRKLIN